MSQCEAASPEDVAELWRQRFGQPPPIVAEPPPSPPVYILEAPARVQPQARTWAEPD